MSTSISSLCHYKPRETSSLQLPRITFSVQTSQTAFSTQINWFFTHIFHHPILTEKLRWSDRHACRVMETRPTVSSRLKEPVEVCLGFDQNASWGPSSGGLPNHWADTHHDAPILDPPGGAGKHCLLLPQRPSSKSVKEKRERMDGGDGIMKWYYGGVWTR